MAQLPEARVNQSLPFMHTGIDYAGPLQIRAYKGRGQKSYKGYIAVFVCLSTKAVHLEVVTDMTTDAFLAAFRRFMARRGSCLHVYSDNGTNFVGAVNLLEKEFRSKILTDRLQDQLATVGITWHFIPPASPNFGGLWEAAVRSMKHHLKRIIGEATLTYEELTTLTSQIEACLNSRPLWPPTMNPDEVGALTPGHFLVGRPLVVPYTSIVSLDTTTSHAVRWKLVQKMRRDFWSSEYLHSLQSRYK